MDGDWVDDGEDAVFASRRASVVQTRYPVGEGCKVGAEMRQLGTEDQVHGA